MGDDRKQALADLLADEGFYVDDQDESVSSRTGWAIQNKQSLEWALMRDSALQAERDHILAAYEEALKRLTRRRDSLLDRIQRGIVFFESHIAKFAHEQRERLLGGGAKKSVDLLNGRIGWRKRAGRLVVVDDKALTEWLRSQPNEDLYRVKVEPEMRALQDNYQKNGTIPPGTEFQADSEKFYIEPANLDVTIQSKF